MPDELTRNAPHVHAAGAEFTGGLVLDHITRRLGLASRADIDVPDIGCGVRLTQTIVNCGPTLVCSAGKKTAELPSFAVAGGGISLKRTCKPPHHTARVVRAHRDKEPSGRGRSSGNGGTSRNPVYLGHEARKTVNDVEAVAAQTTELARVAAQRVHAGSLGAFREGVLRRLAQYGDHPCLHRWLDLADAGPEAVRATLLDVSDDGRVMRSFAPLRTLISREERDRIMARIGANLAESA